MLLSLRAGEFKAQWRGNRKTEPIGASIWIIYKKSNRLCLRSPRHQLLLCSRTASAHGRNRRNICFPNLPVERRQVLALNFAPLREIQSKDLAAFNRQVRKANIPP